MDIALAIDALCPGARYGGSVTDNTEAAYQALRWEDERQKPEWSALVAVAAVVDVQRRKAEILSELAAIDAASARPLRAILVGSATDEDRARLTELDEQAAALRVEMAALEPPPAA
jgi:hypothetical protein